MKKILLLLFISALLLAGQAVYAADAIILVSPIPVIKNADSIFTVNVQLNPQGNRSCVVKGTVNFTNSTCQNIIVQSGLMAQITPTCQSPSFIIGIPKCTTALQNILTVSAKSKTVGQAQIAVSGTNIIGAEQIQSEVIPENVTPASFLTVASKYFWPLLILLIVIGFVYWIYNKSSKKKT